MKKTVLLLALLGCLVTYSQVSKPFSSLKGEISGKILDDTTKESLPYVNIIVKNTSNKILTGGITDAKGSFIIKDIPLGALSVEIQFMGYANIIKNIRISRKQNILDIGVIYLKAATTSLDEVEVRAETSTISQKIDRKVVNVGKDLTSSGTTASELFDNIPSVSVDSQTGNISLRGNENVRVLVDGRPSTIPTADLLKQLPSSSIKSIELITNPSAKYNPEGMSGIINIILNKNANIGFNAFINGGVQAGHYVRYDAATNINYKTGKVNFFSNYSLNTGDRYRFGAINRPNFNSQDIRFKNARTSHFLKFGADVYLDDKNTLSFYTTQNWFNGDGSVNTLVFDTFEAIQNNASNSIQDEGKNQAYNLNYKHDFDEDHHIEFESTYSTNKSPRFFSTQEKTNPQDGTANYTNNIEDAFTNLLMNLDYTSPVSKQGKLEIGLEYRKDNTDNSIITTQTNSTNSSFEYERNIYSGYVNYGHQFKKISMQLGARIEQFLADGTFNQENVTPSLVADDIFTIYPSAFFTFNPNDKDQFQLSYSKRVDRPSISQINPIVRWASPLVTSTGNENLLPQFTNSIEFNYTRKVKGGSFSFGSFYRNTKDVISRATYRDPNAPNDRLILTFRNFSETSAYGLEFSANYRIAKWWRTNTSLDFYSQEQFGTIDVDNTNETVRKVKNEVFNARISNSFTLSKKLRLQLFAMYRGGRENIQRRRDPMSMVNLGANYSILKNKGNITFRINDIFNTMHFQFSSFNPFVQNGRFKWESRTAYLGFSYRFGSGKNKAKSRRKRDGNETKGNGNFI